MFDNIIQFFKRFKKGEKEESKSTAKERLHLVLAQDRANISADFLEMMKQEILEVIKKYIDIDEKAIDVRLTNKEGEDGSLGAPALYANIPIITIKNEARKLEGAIKKEENIEQENIRQENVEHRQEENNELEENNENKDENIEQNSDNSTESIETEKIEDVQQETDENNLNEVENEKKNS